MGGTGKIIIAHSNQDFCENFAQALEGCGYEVSVVKSLKDIIKKTEASGSSYRLVGVPLEEMSVADSSIFEKFMADEHQRETKVFAVISKSTKFSQVVLEKVKILKPRDFIVENSPTEEIVFRLNNILFEENGVRKNYRALVNIVVHCDYMQDFFDTESFTISRDGIYLKTERNLPRDANLFITFRLPAGNRDFATMGNVLYTITPNSPKPRISPPGSALYFVDLKSDERDLIDESIRGTS